MENFIQLQEYFKSKMGKELKITDDEAVKLVRLNNVKLMASIAKGYIDLDFKYKYYTVQVVIKGYIEDDAFLVYINNDYGCLLEGVFNFNELDKFSKELNRALFEFTSTVDQRVNLSDLDLQWK